MRFPQRTIAGLAGVAAVLVSVVACSSSPPPKPVVVSSPAPTPSASVRPVPVTDEPDGSDGAASSTDSPPEPIDTAPSSSTVPDGTAPPAQPVSCPSGGTTVGGTSGLTSALASAHPGDVIDLANGTYTGNFEASASGTSAQPIWLCGGPGAILDGGQIKSDYVFHLNKASYWRLVGFTVQNGQKGVVTDGSEHTVIQGLTVRNVGDEAIHLRSASSSNLVIDNTVSGTGLHSDKFGEGIYIGSAKSNWGTYAGGGPDRSDDNVIQGNHISNTTAESVDIKEGTTGGILADNTFDGSGMAPKGADSWVDVKGNDWTIEGNVGTHSLNDGFQVHVILKPWGTGNVFKNNVANVNGPGYGINVGKYPDNTVQCNNRATGAASGMTNVTCTP